MIGPVYSIPSTWSPSQVGLRWVWFHLCELITVCSILANALPNSDRLQKSPRLCKLYSFTIHYVAFLALNWRHNLPSLDLEFLGFKRHEHNFRNLAILVTVLLLAGIALAQSLPEAPKPTKAFALNAGFDTRYSLNKNTTEFSPRLGIDYRLTHYVRVGISYSHGIPLNGPFHDNAINGYRTPSQTNSLSITTNFKLFEFGPGK